MIPVTYIRELADYARRRDDHLDIRPGFRRGCAYSDSLWPGDHMFPGEPVWVAGPYGQGYCKKHAPKGAAYAGELLFCHRCGYYPTFIDNSETRARFAHAIEWFSK